ncbi:hypothetical protein F511_27587 [Dorcoceras hygrometricum]|uniref:Uncharacterized protein n=1 Tax=Dorcoceras hygrometricum TaxID=472368 RepID=A0A2Z7BV83_9LAMI|nr:hypothetical protein F511_27587 [Dorcoceras hygrometricum]
MQHLPAATSNSTLNQQLSLRHADDIAADSKFTSTNYRYPRMRASGKSSTTKHRLLHASGPHPIPPPNDPNLKTELSKLMIENESLKNKSSELKAENEKLNEVMSSWTKSFSSLDKLFEIQKPASDRTGLGFNTSESSTGEICTQSNLAHDKFKKMSFVKASVIHDPCESVRYDDQILELLNKKGKSGIGYDRPESSKSGWLKNRLDKEKAKAGSKSSVQNQQRRGSKKVKSEWRKVRPHTHLNGQKTKPKLNKSHSTYAQTLMDYHTGKAVKVIQVWVQKGVILSGPK